MAASVAMAGIAGVAQATEQPNILVIMADDIGYWNLSTYHQGMMGYNTPNIDRIADEGAKFTNYYGQQSSTAGRAAFITGQMPKRTGLTKVGMPGSDLGIQKEDVTIATILREMGYKTGQFGKNHLGDKDEFLPTNHGFDEFFGNLYHLNAEEEPEYEEWPEDPAFNKLFKPRGVIKSTADGKIEDTGPLTRKRMETVDKEFNAAAMDFMERSVKEDKPFFTWVNPARMHAWIHLEEKSKGVTGHGVYADGMVEHDKDVGQLLNKLEELGVDDNTIIVYTSDNGAQLSTFPHGGATPFRGQKATGWEGGFRVPALIKWPGTVEPGTNIGGMFAAEDWLPTLVSAAGNPTIKNELLEGKKIGDQNYRVMIDGYNQTSLLQGKEDSLRNEFFYWSDDGDLLAVRNGDYKFHFQIQEATGIDVWANNFKKLRFPMMFDLSVDPFERADEGMGYNEWRHRRNFLSKDAVMKVKQMMATFKEFPPRQDPASFTIE
ncbi:arylsulfatase [Endozoicomonas sp. (ex Bugula neritina AB1)]|nr:arylsulfatase [Endozoicomonas sp. (ex Bugula neritina AB1)]